MICCQGIKHVIDDLFNGFWDLRQWRQLQRCCLHQLYSIRTLNSEVLKFII